MPPPLTTDELDARVRTQIYDSFLTEGKAVRADELARRVGSSPAEVKDSLARLADAHMLVLQPESGEILMANPFSAVPTPFRVEAEGRGWWANCIWDALGVCAMAGVDAVVLTSCPDCGEGMTLRVNSNRLEPSQGVVHFAVPAARWWEDIVFT